MRLVRFLFSIRTPCSIWRSCWAPRALCFCLRTTTWRVGRSIAKNFIFLCFLPQRGRMVLAASRNFASFFLGLELLSVALYALIPRILARESLH